MIRVEVLAAVDEFYSRVVSDFFHRSCLFLLDLSINCVNYKNKLSNSCLKDNKVFKELFSKLSEHLLFRE